MKIPLNLIRFSVKGLTKDELVRFEQSIGFALPTDYQTLLLTSDGMSIDGGILVYGTDDLVERNDTLEVGEYTPGYIAIGDSGEGSVFLMKLASNDTSIYAVDAGVMDVTFMRKVGNSLEEWMTNGCPFRVAD
jgi:hypothetical protein